MAAICPRCGTPSAARPGRAARCLDCGSPLPAPPPARHAYETAFGTLVARVQKSGRWAAAAAVSHPDAGWAARLAANLLSAWPGIDHPALPRLHGFDDGALRCTWLLPADACWRPLSQRETPLPPDEVAALVRALAGGLARLHDEGLGAYDLAPEVVFCPADPAGACLVPTPWLASLAARSPTSPLPPGAAPELSSAAGPPPDPARADVYALGVLAWRLLTGGPDRRGAELPGDRSPGLAGWDAFVDGCCRSNPERRFGSVAEALRSVPAPDAGAAPPPVRAAPTPLPAAAAEGPPPGGGRRRRPAAWAAAAAVLAACVVAALATRWDRLVPDLPAALGVAPPFRRGFADTVLAHRERGYEGASWKKLKEADSLALLAVRPQDAGIMKFTRVVGWDDDSFWVAADCFLDGLVFRCRGGHWSLQARLEYVGEPTARVLDADTLLVASAYDVEHDRRRAVAVTADGVREFGPFCGCGEICPAAPDLFYFYSRGRHPALKVAGGSRALLKEGSHKDASVHRRDNTPLAEFPAYGVRLTRAYERGRAVGVAVPTIHQDMKIVTLEDGIWYESARLPPYPVIDGWLTESGGTYTYFLVGMRGTVVRHAVGGATTEVPLTAPSERTSFDLIKVWGTGPEKFWAMDRSGTVWERTPDGGRVVVRGMFADGVEFVDAWAGPGGAVVAVTGKHVYRLE